MSHTLEQTSKAATCAGCRNGKEIFSFTMAFQPIVDLQEERIDTHEALVRGTGGDEAAAVLSRVTSANLYAFDQACRVKAIELAARLGMSTRLSINFLPNAVYEPRACIQATLRAAARSGFRLDRLTFEILETEQAADRAHLANIIGEYRKHGFQIALDDFASAHSGLLRLAELKPDIIKLDRALVMDCDQNRTRLSIIGGIFRICAEIGIKVVAEGVERDAEARALRSVGARFVQGYLFARPRFEGLVLENEIGWAWGG